MADRQEIIKQIAQAILVLPSDRVIRVGIDGVDGAGKTCFADDLASVLEGSGRSIIRATVDAFHNSKSARYRLGPSSPEGYFLDSFNYPQLKEVLLDPLSPSGSGRYRTAIFDHRSDSAVTSPEKQVEDGAVLLFDGIFLHRPELRAYWDYSVFLEVHFDISIARCAQRDGGSPDPQAPENRRYVEGQKIYLQTCDPKNHAAITINNDNLASPYIVV